MSYNYPPWLEFEQNVDREGEIETRSSELQEETAADCLSYLLGDKFEDSQPLNSYGVPSLQRAKHASYLKNFLGKLPSGFAAADASKPWLYYWSLIGLALLGEDVEQYRDRLVSTLKAAQNKFGGFGGGPWPVLPSRTLLCGGSFTCHGWG